MSSDRDRLAQILADPQSRDYRNLRDRAAYMFATGSHPSHLRTFFSSALRLISKMHNQPPGTDGLGGGLRIQESVAAQLALAEHPMVLKVRTYIAKGYRIRVCRGPKARLPYTKVFLFNGRDRCTVQVDGSVLDHWPGPHEI